jgi:hypothetical protein
MKIPSTSSAQLLAVVGALFLLACEQDAQGPVPTGNAEGQSAALAVAITEWPVVQADRVSLSPAAIESKTRRAAEVLASRPLGEDLLQRDWERAEIGGGVGPLRAMLAERPSVRVVYNEGTDDLSLDDVVIQRDTTPAQRDEGITEKQAIQLFHSKVQGLADAGLLSVDDFDLENLHVGYMEQGIARSDQQLSTKVYGYIIRALRKLNGLPVRNSLVAVTVHRSGVVAGIRLLRTSYHLENLQAKASSTAVDATRSRFATTYPAADIAKEGPSYFLPDAPSGTVEPVYSVSFSVVGDVGGERSVSRKLQARYSLTDPGREPIIDGGPNGPILTEPADSKK